MTVGGGDPSRASGGEKRPDVVLQELDNLHYGATVRVYRDVSKT